MSEVEIQSDERVDSLRVQQMKIIQKENQFSFSVDAVLLAHFATIKPKAIAADLGTGTGIISLLLAWRGAERVDALEINPTMAEVAARSVKLNNLTDKITVHNIDMRAVKPQFTTGSFDLVVSNPPYRPVTQGQVSQID